VEHPDAPARGPTEQVVERMNNAMRKTTGVENWFPLGGFSMLDGTNTSNSATFFIAWKDWSQRADPSLSQAALKKAVEAEFADIKEARIAVFIPPSIRGLGVAGGFQMQVEDREGVGLDELEARTQSIVDASQKRGEIGMTYTSFRARVPQIYLNI